MRKVTLALLMLLGVPSLAQANVLLGSYPVIFSIDGAGDLVYCELREVRLLAENPAACEQAGGRVTHHHTQRVEEIEE